MKTVTPVVDKVEQAPGPAGMILAVLLSGIAVSFGVPLSGDSATTVACIALLVFGLPHGTLDLELVRARATGPMTALVPLLVLYLGLAGAMFALWRIEPVLALAIFIGVAVVHFAEDWDGTGSRILAGSLSLALLAAPSLFFRAELDAIFIGITDRAAASIISQALALLAPFSLGLAAIGALILWRCGEQMKSIAAVAAIAGMTFLPPIIGFAAYFCLFHSPRHFADTLEDLNLKSMASWGRIVMPLTLLAGALAAIVFALELRAEPSTQVMTASFMTLSILTVPHMLVPVIIARFGTATLVQKSGKAFL